MSLKRNMSIFLIWSLFFITALSVHAEGGVIYTVGTDNLNIRADASFEADVVGQLNSGDQVNVFKELNGWVQTYYKGEAVWVASQYLIKGEHDIVNMEGETNTNIISIEADSVRLRTGPGTNYDIIGHTSAGNTYKLIEKNGDWLKVLLTSGESAWVASSLTSINNKQNTNQLKGYNIVLDAGHGGDDPGSISVSGRFEKDFTLKVTEAVASNLRDAGANVLLTRSTDRHISLEQRVAVSHAYLTDAFISFHYDAYPVSSANGMRTHYYTNEDAKLAKNIQTSLEKHVPLKSRGILHDSLYVLRENQHVSVLVELGFMTNIGDLMMIQSPEHDISVAHAITEGLISYFN